MQQAVKSFGEICDCVDKKICVKKQSVQTSNPIENSC